ncbi:hypothetical protein GH714_014480 [Hevea brasiliensis]|uniref:Metal-nicotianamine transporter YSL7 n=1 Tax=Hevea brasiliensis TaxID=3981 RepID=A0A6A6KNL5_HEVBR|nr:hypothetical protein GH714_014480 [Hevea brasiliensis]
MAIETSEERNRSSDVAQDEERVYLDDAEEKKKKKKNINGLEQESELESVEKIFEAKEVPPWQNQLTLRAFVVSFILGILFSFIVMKLNLTTGVIPSLNVSAGLLGFFLVKTWTKLLHRAGLLKQPFTRQENTVIQTCVVATSGIAFSGGFGSYLFAMSEAVAKQSTESNAARNIKNPSLGWMIGFLFVVSFLGLFSVVPLRKIMIIDFKLIYPSGTATAHLINSFHTPQGAKLAKFYFDFSATYVGVGMICPYLINVSLLVGAILSWGIMWPLINNRKGDWYSEEHSSGLHGLQGYKVFIAIALILGDGAYNFFKVLGRTLFGLYQQFNTKDISTVLPVANRSSPVISPTLSYDDQKRSELFLGDQIPSWFAVGGYVIIAIISAITVPHIFHQLKWYYIVVIYIIAPILAFCNAYGCGLTDWSLASTYGKLAIFTIGAWAGAANGGVLAGLAACGVMMNIVSTASDLMQDFKTGYMTLASPRLSMTLAFLVQSIQLLLLVYRNMSILGVEGFSALPKHCLTLCYIFFAAAIVINAIRDTVGKKRARFIPIPMAMAIPFYIGGYFAIDMCIGSLILFIWRKINKAKADAFGPAVASGLICGDGIWTLPSSILSLAGVKPPICMKFLSRNQNAKVDGFLNS